MKLKIYIVDDEQMAIEYLIYLLKNIHLDYEIVGKSTNSVKALHEIQMCKPDVVFADITMPVMDGLELAEQIMKKIPMRIFLLTSYRDFDFVKRGMQIGITDYILKNDLNEHMLQELLEKTLQSIETERRNEHLILEHNVRKFLLSSSSEAEDHVYEHKPMQRYGMISVWNKSKIYMKHQNLSEKQPADCYELHNLNYPKGIQCSAFTEMPNGEYCGIFFIKSDVSDGQKLLYEAGEVVQNFFAEKEVQVCCMISETKHHFMELQNCYQEQVDLCGYLYGYTDHKVLGVRFLKERVQEKNFPDSWMGTLNDHLEKHEFEMTENQIKEWIRNWSESLTIWEFTDNLKNVYRCFKSYALRYQMDSEIFYIPEYFEDIEEILTHMKECLRMMKSIHEKEITTDLSLYIQQAIAYIKNNYGRDISIPDIADAVGISEGHLRRLFKQELNVKVLDYLTEYRLECAKLLMKRKEDSLSEIWRKTGFASAQYFSYVFKRKEGILPKDYIKQIRND